MSKRYCTSTYHTYTHMPIEQYHLALSNLPWKQLINEQTESWFIDKRPSYGNYRYLLRMMSIPYVLYVALEVGAAVYFESFSYLMRKWMLTAFPLVFACVVFCKFRANPAKDIYRLSHEIKYQCFGIIFCQMANTAAIGICTGVVDDERIETLCDVILVYALLFGLALSSTAYPVWLHYSHEASSNLSVCLQRDASNYKQRVTGIEQIAELIATKKGFVAFMKHLV